MYRILAISVVLLSVLVSCHNTQDNNTEVYRQGGGQTQYTLEGLDHGLIQSPVNILTFETSEHVDHDIKVVMEDTTKSLQLTNTGHSVKLEFEKGTSIQFNGKTYEFLQAHFHTPSEHQIDGITFPMEIHFVCKDNSKEPNYLVAGALFKMGEENLFIRSFIEKIPESADHTTHLKDNPVYIDDLLLPEEPFNDYFHYRGSLTTPPYTESVEWFIMKRIIEASPEQIQYINKLEGNNARNVQALFGRNIEN